MTTGQGGNAAPQRQLPLDLRLRDASRFASFYPGGNRLARDAVEALSIGTGMTEPQILLHGPAGLGKTHLLQAACHQGHERGEPVAYLPLAELVTAPPLAVLDGLERARLVALDDLDAVVGQGDWDEALFGLLNRLRDGGCRVLLAAAHAPDGLGSRLPDLTSRLAWGPVFRIQAPEEEDLKRILAQRAVLRGLELPEAVAEYLLRHYRRDLVALLELLDRLDLAALAEQRRLTIPFVRDQLARF
ncbi:DnaA regulatory inactivator Hda [Thioalkalivibrio sp. ALMg13-2]|uniref:DnaA regulatory inactivator Hda n=1 Tax=Thioalkalivibrio sp. ALMg13-2 TaxID=1158167 RepID=UPI000374F5D6|nr:DnaA regulatory inactivator Hda [Thioalkalivibrio sp. ALMg13-2]